MRSGFSDPTRGGCGRLKSTETAVFFKGGLELEEMSL
jgi:hypothetical protein